MMNKLIVCILLLCGMVSTAYTDGVSVHLSQRKVGLNDSFSVTFSTGQGVKDPPDFSPLQMDFEIVSNSHNKSISIINGQMTQETRWNLVLISKQEGNLVIPSIQFGEYSSSPQAIEVTKAATVKHDDAIFIETELSPKNSVYEQALLIYTVRLYCSAQMAQATLSELNVNDKDAIAERLGKDAEYEHYHNGKYYRVYERKYAVFPQHAGELVFSPLVFEGAVVSGSSFFDIQTKIKRLYSDKLSIQVQPIPTTFQKDNWLAANDVKLTEDWSADPEKAVLGEPITWTLKLTVNGCLGDHIPDIAMHFPSDLKYYLDKPEISNQTTADGCIGIKQIKVALIATKPGEIQLPKIVVPWWDLKADKIQQVELPGRTLKIQDSNIAMNPPSTVLLPTSSVLSQGEVANANANSHHSFLWIWYVLGLAAFLVIGLLLAAYKIRKAKGNKSNSLSHLKRDLKKACREGNTKHAEACLLVWFAQMFPESKVLNLLTIKHFLNEELQVVVLELYQALYGINTAWDGERLWKAFCAYKPHKTDHKAKEKEKKKKKEDILPNLYQ